METAIKQAILNELKKIKNTKENINTLELDNPRIIQSIFDITEQFLNIYLAENQEITTTLQELGKKHGLSQEEITKHILEEKEKVIKDVIIRLSLYEALCSLCLKYFSDTLNTS